MYKTKSIQHHYLGQPFRLSCCQPTRKKDSICFPRGSFLLTRSTGRVLITRLIAANAVCAETAALWILKGPD